MLKERDNIYIFMTDILCVPAEGIHLQVDKAISYLLLLYKSVLL